MLNPSRARAWFLGAILTAFVGAAAGCSTTESESEVCDEAKGELCPAKNESLKGSSEASGQSGEGQCVCADVYAPVCGRDEKTYGNACEAGCVDIDVAYEGACKAAEDDPGCVCDTVYAPVCGDNGKTYSNACEAGCADVKVVHEGACGQACQSDKECPHGRCEHGVTCAGLDCPPPPPNRCVVCGDGSQLTCKALPGPCPNAGQVREIIDGCYGECVDRLSCKSLATTPKPCVATGCSGEVCSDESVATPCVVRPEHACFRKASCERQAAGDCGWTQTPSLLLCIENAKSSAQSWQ